MHPLADQAFQWWLGRLPKYNRGLVVAGVSAFVAYVLIGFLLLPASEGFEVTLFTLVIQSVGYLVIIALANICYLIGPVSESLLRPDDVHRYREKWHTLGSRLSFALPFSVPVMLLVVALLKG